MSPLAENRTVITRRLFRQGMLRLSRDNYGKAAAKAMLLFAGLWLGLLVYTLAFGGSLGQTLSYLILLGLIGLFLCVYLPRNNVQRRWKAHAAKYGDASERQTLFFPDRLTVTGEGIEKQIPYSEIAEIKESGRLLILICRDHSAVLLEKQGFSGADIHEIKALLHSANHKE